MKKRTACFGWTKTFQRRMETARRWLILAASLSGSNPEAEKHLHSRAMNELRAVKSEHRKRVIALRRRQA